MYALIYMCIYIYVCIQELSGIKELSGYSLVPDNSWTLSLYFDFGGTRLFTKNYLGVF